MQKIFYGTLVLWICIQANLFGVELLSNDRKWTPIKAEILKTDKGFELLRNGKPYFIKGAGAISHYHRISAYGGNSIRTWSTDNAKSILDSAQQHGLTVMLGLPVAAERHGFDYSDEKAVKKQFEKIKADVIKFKGHPALLAWGIGNELNLSYQNPKVWDAINDIALMIKEVDPFHLKTTVLAGVNQKEIDHIKEKVPAIDLLAVNTYGGLAELPERLKACGWNGPYIVTEWGPTGHWEGLITEWGAPVEETSSEKAAVYKNRYRYSVERDKAHCLGSYVFLWGQKQERTPTWYGLLSADGKENHVMDIMQYVWTGVLPENKAPQIYGFVMNGLQAHQNVYLNKNKNYEVTVTASDPDHDEITYRWELLSEATNVGEGGDYERKPETKKMRYSEKGEGKITFTSPKVGGAYRLFVYVHDGKNKIATANIPFFVKQ